MAIASVIHTNQHSIDRVLNAGAPVVLAFWRPDSPLPAGVESALDRLARAYAGKAIIAKVDAAAETPVAARFGVSSAPAVVFIKDGRRESLLPGAPGEEELRGWLEHLVHGKPRPRASAAQPQQRAGTGSGAAAYTSQGGARSSAAPLTLSDSTFAQAIAGPVPVLVDFWAPWCGPCRMVAPVVEQLAQEFAGRAVVAKLNVDENPQTAGRYRVMSIPTLAIFKQGRLVETLVGAQPAAVLRQKLAQHVSA